AVLLIGSFVGASMVQGGAGLIAALGADLGSALMVRLLSLDHSVIASVALLLGLMLFSAPGGRRAVRHMGRLLIGAGLLLLSLNLIREASEPLRQSEMLPVIVRFLASDPLIAFMVSALLTWLLHSSVAFILLIAALA